MNTRSLKRPTSAAEVAAWSETYADFGANLKDFLHTIARCSGKGGDLTSLFAAAPAPRRDRFPEGLLCDAFLAALADYVSRRNGLVSPAWSQDQSLPHPRPWFSPPELGLRALVIRDTPSAFKDKNIFILPSALEVA